MITTTLGAALLAYLVGAAFALKAMVENRAGTDLAAVAATALGWVLHTVSLGAVCVVNQGWPLGSASENISFIAWSMVGLAFLFAWRAQATSLAAFAIPLVALLTTVALMRSDDPEVLASLQLIPRGTWLWIHIALMLLAVAALAISGLVGFIYLLQERQLKSRRPGGLLTRLPSLEVCDRLGYRALAVAFTLLTAGLITGVVNSMLPGQVQWSWDLTKGLALVIWIVNLALLYGRWAVGWRGRKAAYLAVAGTLSVTGLLLGVLLFAGTFHPIG